jgi:hypothetical protein
VLKSQRWTSTPLFAVLTFKGGPRRSSSKNNS